MHEYDIRKLSRTRQVVTIVFFIALGVVLGFFLDPERGWQSYIQSVLIGAIAVVFSSIAGGNHSFPETVDAYRKYRFLQTLLISAVIGIATGITSYVRYSEAGFAGWAGLLTTIWLFIVTLGGTWVVQRVTRRGIAARDNRPSQSEGQTRSSYEDRISHASRRARPGTKD